MRPPVYIDKNCTDDPFPNPDDDYPDGLIAVGANLSASCILAAYRKGIFPWYNDDFASEAAAVLGLAEKPMLWFSPDPRFILDLAEVHVPKRLNRLKRQGRYRIAFDCDFRLIVEACARVARPKQDGTWITDPYIDAYCQLYHAGTGHCVAVYDDSDQLVGGLYGLSLGSSFFGESMFSRVRNASKLAFLALIEHLQQWQFDFIDCQVASDHLQQFGCKTIPRSLFLRQLCQSIAKTDHCGNWQAIALKK